MMSPMHMRTSPWMYLLDAAPIAVDHVARQ